MPKMGEALSAIFAPQLALSFQKVGKVQRSVQFRLLHLFYFLLTTYVLLA